MCRLRSATNDMWARAELMEPDGNRTWPRHGDDDDNGNEDDNDDDDGDGKVPS